MGVTQEAATAGSRTTAAMITSPQLPGLVQREACSCAPTSREAVGLSGNSFLYGLASRIWNLRRGLRKVRMFPSHVMKTVLSKRGTFK